MNNLVANIVRIESASFVAPLLCVFLVMLWPDREGMGMEIETVPYGVGSWELDKRGSHRAVVRVEEPADAVRAFLPWRRRDLAPETKAVIVTDARTGSRIDNVVTLNVTGEYGDIVFQPVTVPGDYHVYYLPHPEPRHLKGPVHGRIEGYREDGIRARLHCILILRKVPRRDRSVSWLFSRRRIASTQGPAALMTAPALTRKRRPLRPHTASTPAARPSSRGIASTRA